MSVNTRRDGALGDRFTLESCPSETMPLGVKSSVAEVIMLYDGPWAQCIVAYEADTSEAFERYFTAAHRCADHSEQRFGQLPTLDPETQCASRSIGRPDGAFGVQVNGQIQAVALYSLCGTAPNKSIMRLLIGVALEHRRRGMGTALLMRATVIARRAGVRYLVLEDVDADARRIAQQASAELVFCNGECQGWIELSPQAPASRDQSSPTSATVSC